MSDIGELHAQALEQTGRIVAGIKPGQWQADTPCDGWDVHALLNHVVAGNLWAAELGAGATIEDVADRLDGDMLGADPAASYVTSAAAAAATFRRPGAMDAPCAVSYGPVPGSVYAGHRFLDVFVHGWDLAVATGQDPELDPGLMRVLPRGHRATGGGVPRGGRLRRRAAGPAGRDRPAAVPGAARPARVTTMATGPVSAGARARNHA